MGRIERLDQLDFDWKGSVNLPETGNKRKFPLDTYSNILPEEKRRKLNSSTTQVSEKAKKSHPVLNFMDRWDYLFAKLAKFEKEKKE